MRLAVAVEPVKATPAMRTSSISFWPISGRPTARTQRILGDAGRVGEADGIGRRSRGVCEAGLATTLLPAASAAETWPRKMASGKFQGAMQTQAPRPSRRMHVALAGRPGQLDRRKVPRAPARRNSGRSRPPRAPRRARRGSSSSPPAPRSASACRGRARAGRRAVRARRRAPRRCASTSPRSPRARAVTASSRREPGARLEGERRRDRLGDPIQRRPVVEVDAPRCSSRSGANRSSGSGIDGWRVPPTAAILATGSASRSVVGQILVGELVDEGGIGAILEQPPDEIGEQVAMAADRRIDAGVIALVADQATRRGLRPCRAAAGTRSRGCRRPIRAWWRRSARCGWRRPDRCASPSACPWRRRGRRRRSPPCA